MSVILLVIAEAAFTIWTGKPYGFPWYIWTFALLLLYVGG